MASTTFKVFTVGGKMVKADLLAEFDYVIGGRRFEFVITQRKDEFVPVITHRLSGKKVRDVGVSAKNVKKIRHADLVTVAKLTMDELIAQATERRVHAILAESEDGRLPEFAN